MDENFKKQAYLMELQMYVGSKTLQKLKEYAGKEFIPTKELSQLLLDAQMFMASGKSMYSNLQEATINHTLSKIMEENNN